MVLHENLENTNRRPLCANGCGFFGSEENQNLCSKCFRDFQKQEHGKASKEDTEPQEDVNMFGPLLCCANGCGFFEKKNLRSKCCRNDLLKEETEKIAKEPVLEKPLDSDAQSSSAPDIAALEKPLNSDAQSSSAPNIAASAKGSTTAKNRCKTCNKKIGLTGFECRCGNMFCRKHRYPEEHACTVDLKSMGRELLAKHNPVCKGDKLKWRL